MPRYAWISSQSGVQKYRLCSQTLFCRCTFELRLCPNIFTWSRNARLWCKDCIHRCSCPLHGSGGHSLNKDWRFSQLCVRDGRRFGALRSQSNYVYWPCVRTIDNSSLLNLQFRYRIFDYSIGKQSWSGHPLIQHQTYPYELSIGCVGPILYFNYHNSRWMRRYNLWAIFTCSKCTHCRYVHKNNWVCRKFPQRLCK